MADYIRPTPRNPILGLLADALTGGVDWMRDRRQTQQMQGLGGLLAETGIPATMERLSYGEPLTKGKGMTTRLRPEAEAALMTLGPEAVPIGRGAMAAVRATKGLPVGAGIKPLNLSEGIFKPELTMQEMLRVKDIPTVQRMQKSMDLVGEKNFKGMVEDIFKKYKPTDQDQEAMLVEAVTLDILGRANRNPELLRGLPGLKTPAPQEEALRLAQQRAALPVSEGGLGLPPNNTPMDRARAMGFNTDVYHGTTQDVPAFDISRAGSSSGHESAKIPAVWTTRRPEVANIFTAENVHDAYPVSIYGPAGGGLRSIRVLKTLEGGNVMPLMLRGTPEETLTAGQAQRLIFNDKGGDWRDAGSNFSERFNEKPVLTKIKGHPQAELEFRADQYVVPDPSMLRSRFAAFDPTRRNEPDLLAGALPFTALLDEENRALLEERLGGLLGR